MRKNRQTKDGNGLEDPAARCQHHQVFSRSSPVLINNEAGDGPNGDRRSVHAAATIGPSFQPARLLHLRASTSRRAVAGSTAPARAARHRCSGGSSRLSIHRGRRTRLEGSTRRRAAVDRRHFVRTHGAGLVPARRTARDVRPPSPPRDPRRQARPPYDARPHDVRVHHCRRAPSIGTNTDGAGLSASHALQPSRCPR